MGKAKYLAFLLLCAPLAWGQCSPNPCYTDNKPTISMLTPAQAAAQGNMTATISETANITGSMPSHNMTVTPGVDVWWDRRCNNCTGATAVYYYQLDNGPKLGPYSLPLQGSAYALTTTTGDVGHIKTYTYAVTENGNTMQDVIVLSIVAGTGPSVVSQDEVPENALAQLNTSGGGGSMMNDFTECELDPIKCTNPSATHTPFTTLNLYNRTQGTSQVNLKHQSGNIANATSSVSFGDSIILPADSNDILDFEEQDEVDCSLFGPISLPDYHLRLIPYQIFDKVDSYDGKVRFQVEPWCYNCCIPAKQGCPEPITLTDHVSYSPGGNPPKIPTFFYSLGFCANGNFPGMVSGQWECSPGLAIPFYGSGWIKAYCTPYENPPY